MLRKNGQSGRILEAALRNRKYVGTNSRESKSNREQEQREREKRKKMRFWCKLIAFMIREGESNQEMVAMSLKQRKMKKPKSV